ncbi:MAG: pyrroline-5-carboxylate reductase family protein, partial [Chitinophagaceae bacterium]
MKATIIGAGNIGMALADGLIRSKSCLVQDITLTRRSTTSLDEYNKKGFAVTTDNSAAIRDADIIFLCILPQQLNKVLEEIKPAFISERQLIVSVVTGVHTDDISKQLTENVRVIRAMPNT